MDGFPFSPKGTSSSALAEHAKNVAQAIQIDPEQMGLLVSEIRNALGPVYMTVHRDSLSEVDPEEHEDAKASLARVLALMDAFSAKVRVGVR